MTIDRTDHTDKIHTYLFCFETSLILKDSARHTNMAMIVAHMIVEFKRGILADEWKSNSWGSFGLSVAEFVGGGSVYTDLVSWFCWTQLLLLASNYSWRGEHWCLMSKWQTHTRHKHLSFCQQRQEGQLRTCNGCKTFEYCSAAFANWSQHKMVCQTIGQGLCDVELSNEPRTKRKDFDICCLQLSLKIWIVMYQICCGQTIG